MSGITAWGSNGQICLNVEKENLTGHAKTKFSGKGDLFDPERQKAGNKRQRLEIEAVGEEQKRRQGRGGMGIHPGTKVSLEKEKADVADRQMTGKW